MLADDDRARIRAEEVFREEVRRSLEQQRAPAGPAARLWRFLNTSLGQWFLATVILGGATYLFTSWRDDVEADISNRETVARLDIEIATRLDHFANTINHLAGFPAYSAALAAMERPQGSPYATSAYPDLQDRGLSSLVRELRTRVPPPEQAELAQPLRAAQELARIAAGNLERRMSPPVDEAIDFKQLQQVMGLVNDSLCLDRWPATRLQ